MPKDPTKNIARYKIRGGQINEFEFHKQQEEFVEQQTHPLARPDAAPPQPKSTASKKGESTKRAAASTKSRAGVAPRKTASTQKVGKASTKKTAASKKPGKSSTKQRAASKKK